MAEALIHKNITVTGRVQGVFYRASAFNKALELGLKGFVMNQPDGCVYIEAEGTEVQIEGLIDWCREGPAYARIDSLDTDDGEWIGFEKFEIRR